MKNILSHTLALGLFTLMTTGTHAAKPKVAKPRSAKPQAPKTLQLIDKAHKPQVVVAPDATASEKYAAREIATYLGKMSDQTITVTESAAKPSQVPWVVVGHHPTNADLRPEKLELEESVVDVGTQGIRIVGGKLPPIKLPDGKEAVQDRGTLYGAWDFLESLGIRWYRPEAWGEHVPKLPVVRVAQGKRTTKPAFKYRTGVNSYRWYKEDSPETGNAARLWANRNRQNTLTYAEGAELGGNYYLSWDHAYPNLVPASQFFKEHPDYFALIDGKRNPEGQLCLGNPELQKTVVRRVLETAAALPQYEAISLEPGDTDNWCACELCKAMDDPQQDTIFTGATIEWKRTAGNVELSNRVCAFGNIIAREVAKQNPKVKVLWLAYSTHTQAPSLVKTLKPNVMVMAAAFTSSFSDYDASYSDYSRKLRDPASRPNREFLKVLVGYSKMTKNLLTYEYWSGYAWFGPLPLIHTMTDRLREYRKLGILGSKVEMHPHWGPQGLDVYMYGRLQWNPDMDVQKELNLYYKNFYGPAEKPMKAYHELIEQAGQSGTPYYSGGVNAFALFTPQLVKQLGPLIQQARAAVKGKAPYEQRLAGVWAGYEYVRLISAYKQHVKEGDMEKGALALEDANRFILSYKDGSVFDNGLLFSTIGFFGKLGKDLPDDVRAKAKEIRDREAQEPKEETVQ